MINTYKAKVRLMNECGCCISESKANPKGIYEVELAISDTMLEKGDKIEIVSVRVV